MNLEFKFEPAGWTQAASVALGLMVAFGVFDLSADTAAVINTAIVAVAGAVAAVMVRPVAPTVFSTAIAATAVAVSRFGLEFSPEQVGAVQTAAAFIIFLTTRDQQSPVAKLAGGHKPAERTPV